MERFLSQFDSFQKQYLADIHDLRQEGVEYLQSSLLVVAVSSGGLAPGDIFGRYSTCSSLGLAKELIFISSSQSPLELNQIAYKASQQELLVVFESARDLEYCALAVRLLELGCNVCVFIHDCCKPLVERRSPISVMLRACKAEVGRVSRWEVEVWRNMMFARVRKAKYFQVLKYI